MVSSTEEIPRVLPMKLIVFIVEKEILTLDCNDTVLHFIYN